MNCRRCDGPLSHRRWSGRLPTPGWTGADYWRPSATSYCEGCYKLWAYTSFSESEDDEFDPRKLVGMIQEYDSKIHTYGKAKYQIEHGYFCL